MKQILTSKALRKMLILSCLIIGLCFAVSSTDTQTVSANLRCPQEVLEECGLNINLSTCTCLQCPVGSEVNCREIGGQFDEMQCACRVYDTCNIPNVISACTSFSGNWDAGNCMCKYI